MRGGRARLGLLAAALVGICIVAFLPPFPLATASSSDEGQLVSLTNQARASHGLARLSAASDLMAIAHRHSERMAAQHRIYHDPNLGSEVSGWTYLGDNVGRGSSASQVHHAFMNSSMHRANILNSHYNQIGTGAVRGSDGYLYVTEVFARRGSVRRRPSVVRHRAVHRAVVHRRRVRRVRIAATRPRPVSFVESDRSVGMLLALITFD